MSAGGAIGRHGPEEVKMTSILAQLSSAVGDRTNAANQAVVQSCLANPELLADVAEGLLGDDQRLAGDCGEVMTQTASLAPENVIPYAEVLLSALDHPSTRARWEAAHALAEIAGRVPGNLRVKQDRLTEIVRTDSSIIVRDYTVDILANLAGVSQDDARWTYPILLDCLTLWDGRHAGHALPGLGHVAEGLPEYRETIAHHAGALTEHRRGVVRKAAKRLIRDLAQLA